MESASGAVGFRYFHNIVGFITFLTLNFGLASCSGSQVTRQQPETPEIPCPFINLSRNNIFSLVL
jgi:hypothetical protein